MSFSRDPNAVLSDALEKGYSRVRFQQGKPVLDRELNLASDLAGPERLAQACLGSGVLDTGFQIIGLNVAANDFTIRAGRALVAGQVLASAADTTYQSQPVRTNVKPLPAGVSTVSLRAITRMVTEAEDASLRNGGAGDVGTVTAIREKVEWEVVVTPGPFAPRDNLRLATIDTGANTVSDQRRVELNLAIVRDEVAAARGTQPRLSNRLNTSLDASGALKANAVGNAQIADNAVNANKLLDTSVTTNKLADLNVTTNKIADLNVTANKLADLSVTNGKLAASAVQEPKLADNAVSKRTIQDNAVSIAELSKVLVANIQTSVPASSGGQPGLQIVIIDVRDGDGFYLISVRQTAPRNPGPGAINFNFTWEHRVQVFKPPAAGAPFAHLHQILIQNPNTFALTVAVKAYRIEEA